MPELSCGGSCQHQRGSICHTQCAHFVSDWMGLGHPAWLHGWLRMARLQARQAGELCKGLVLHLSLSAAGEASLHSVDGVMTRGVGPCTRIHLMFGQGQLTANPIEHLSETSDDRIILGLHGHEYMPASILHAAHVLRKDNARMHQQKAANMETKSGSNSGETKWRLSHSEFASAVCRQA